jgi:hypothetical protein
VRMFKQGLKIGVRAELMRSGGVVNNLNDLINEAICLDNELFGLALKEQLYLNRPQRTYEEYCGPRT